MIYRGVVTYSYDANGNLLNQSGAGTAVAYAYDVYNRFIQYTEGSVKKTYTYDAEGVRRSKENGDENIYYISDTIGSLSYTLAETDENGNVLATYNRADVLISQVREETTSYYLFDGHGDVRALNNEEGRITDKYRYNAYGELVERSGETENHYLYTGEYYDGTSNLYYLRARYMNPSTGTFISMDTYEGSIYDPDTLHKYLYANGNPVKYSDPSGNMFGSFVAMTIQTTINNFPKLHVMGVISGVTSSAITTFLGGNTDDAIKSFIVGYIGGFGMGAILCVAAAYSAVIYAQMLLLVSSTNALMVTTALVYSILEKKEKQTIVLSVLSVAAIFGLCQACSFYGTIMVSGDKGSFTIGFDNKDIEKNIKSMKIKDNSLLSIMQGDRTMNDKKLIVKQTNREFELLAFWAVKSDLSNMQIIQEELTDAINDGGYDGRFLCVSDEEIFEILFEAKLRSDIKSDLKLNDFAKALVVAITKCADVIYIVTNLHFSKGTVHKISKFSEYSELEIRLYNGYSVKNFIQNNRTIIKEINRNLLDFLEASNTVHSPQYLEKKALQPSSEISIDKNRLQEFDFILNSFRKKQQKLLVTGSAYMGKTYYIEQMMYYFRSKDVNAQVIDVSKCSTYKQLFIELLKKTIGLTFELIDLLDDNSFNESFKEIDSYTLDESELAILRFVFSKQDNTEYDYAVVFLKLSYFFKKLFAKQNRHKKYIIAFLNLSLSDNIVLQLLLYILNDIKMSCVLELTENEYRLINNTEWKKSESCFCALDDITLPPVKIPDWTFKQQCTYLQNNISHITNEECMQLIKKHGNTPKDLNYLVELIGYSDLYEHTPRELIFQDILSLPPNTTNPLEKKCLEYLQLNNSYMLYVYTFLILFSGKVSRDFIKEFEKETNWICDCDNLLLNTSLFKITKNSISVISSKIFECLREYYSRVSHFEVVEKVVLYIRGNIKELHLSTEKMLQLQINMAYYMEEEYINLLIELGNSYLSCNQIEKAYKTFDAAEILIDEQLVTIEDEKHLIILVGLLETTIWKTIQEQQRITAWIHLAETIVKEKADANDACLQIQLKFYLLCYQFHHSLGNTDKALQYAKSGIDLIEKYDLYRYDIANCGKMWRFYAIAVKEQTQSIAECLNVFEMADEKCSGVAKLMFGHIIHKNMTIDDSNFMKCLQEKLDNYQPLVDVERELSVEEYLHYKTNVAALHFNMRHYDTAREIYSKLLRKSAIFGIAREESRILNDMANIEWIDGDIKAANIKYAKAISIAQNAGYHHNYWPILVNYMSLKIYQQDYEAALSIYYEVIPFMEQVCVKVATQEISIETAGYYKAAIIIYIHNIWNIAVHMSKLELSQHIYEICVTSHIVKYDVNNTTEELLQRLSLKNTMYQHVMKNGEVIYVLKD